MRIEFQLQEDPMAQSEHLLHPEECDVRFVLRAIVALCVNGSERIEQKASRFHAVLNGEVQHSLEIRTYSAPVARSVVQNTTVCSESQ